MTDRTFVVRPYVDADASAWDAFVERSCNGTFLQTRKFISYHGDRFTDASMCVFEKDELVAVCPAGVSEQDPKTVSSHPGLTWGGVVRAGQLWGEGLGEVLEAICSRYRSDGFSSWIYKAAPPYQQRRMSQDDEWWMGVHGRTLRSDVAAVVNLNTTTEMTTNRSRSLKKALRNDVTLSHEIDHLARYWDVLHHRLEERHGAQPVHSLDEIRQIAGLFPDNVGLVTAWRDAELLGGVLLFDSATASTAQYIASTESGRDLSALDLVFDDCFRQARESGLQWFNFGTNVTNEGRTLNDTLLRYKLSFGAGAVLHRQYVVDLLGD